MIYSGRLVVGIAASVEQANSLMLLVNCEFATRRHWHTSTHTIKMVNQDIYWPVLIEEFSSRQVIT